MKKILALALTVAGSGLAGNAQLLYQWAFTNSTDTAATSSPTVAITAGTGALGLQNLSGASNAIAAGDIFFTTNVLYGPPGPNGAAGPFGALVCTNMTYNAPVNIYGIATNGDLNLGTLYQFTITWWTQFQPFVVNDSGQQLARTVQFGAVAGYDSGGKGLGNHNGVGQALNGYVHGVGYNEFQDGVANTTGGTNPAVQFANVDFPVGYVCDGQTWYFQAMTYNGLLATANFTQWIAATNPVTRTGTGHLDAYVESIISGPINFTTNAHAIFAGCTGADRNLTAGQLSDIRIYDGILTSNQLVQVMNFGYPTPASPP